MRSLQPHSSMKEYTARFTLNLIKPIKTSNDNFSSVIIDPSQGNIKHIELTPIIESDLINKFKIIAVYT
ncbi:MAG: hypothetical protein ACXW1W_15285, partial [Methylococcaceae bacterium]